MVIADGSDSIRTLYQSTSFKRRLNGETFSVSSPPSQTLVIDTGSPSTMDCYAVKNDVWWAEVLWTSHKVSTHQSYKSSVRSDELLRCMFSDNAIAENVTQFFWLIHFAVIFATLA